MRRFGVVSLAALCCATMAVPSVALATHSGGVAVAPKLKSCYNFEVIQMTSLTRQSAHSVLKQTTDTFQTVRFKVRGGRCKVRRAIPPSLQPAHIIASTSYTSVLRYHKGMNLNTWIQMIYDEPVIPCPASPYHGAADTIGGSCPNPATS